MEGAGGVPGGAGGGAGVAEGEEDATPPPHRRLAKSFSATRPREKPADKSMLRT